MCKVSMVQARSALPACTRCAGHASSSDAHGRCNAAHSRLACRASRYSCASSCHSRPLSGHTASPSSSWQQQRTGAATATVRQRSHIQRRQFVQASCTGMQPFAGDCGEAMRCCCHACKCHCAHLPLHGLQLLQARRRPNCCCCCCCCVFQLWSSCQLCIVIHGKASEQQHMDLQQRVSSSELGRCNRTASRQHAACGRQHDVQVAVSIAAAWCVLRRRRLTACIQ